jgi:glycosyltransferase involved in cell wall biosynthesis
MSPRSYGPIDRVVHERVALPVAEVLMSVVYLNTQVQTEARPVGVQFTVAVLIPCYNEAAAIGKVVSDFRAALPGAEIFVYDNNSTDGTAETAAAAGTVSKLHTIRDGIRILRMIVRLLQQERPLAFYGGCAFVVAMLSLALGIPLFFEFFETGLVPRLPTAVLAASTMLVAFFLGAVGLILNTVTRGRWENKRMRYLAVPGIHSEMHDRTRDGGWPRIAAE